MFTAQVLGLLTARAGPAIDQAIEISATPSPATGLWVGKLVGETAADRAWSSAVLYKNDANPLIQLFQLTGRLHLQSIFGKANGQHFDTSDFKNSGQDEIVWGNHVEARRARIGFQSTVYHHWKIQGDFVVDVDGHDGIGGSTTFYKNIQEGWLAYAPADQFSMAIGKRLIRFSRDFEISSNDIQTIERSAISNFTAPGELSGLWSFGKKIGGAWHYELGAFSNARDREFSQFNDGGLLTIGKLGYDFTKISGLTTCDTTLTYIHNTGPGYKSGKIDPNFTFNNSPPLTDSIALTNDSSLGPLRMITELVVGLGFTGLADQGAATPIMISQSDLIGITLTPSYQLSEEIEAIYRFQLVSSADPNGIRVPARYDRLVQGDDEYGNTYTAHYLGLNYLIYRHKLKLMGGLEYAHLGGGSYSGYTALTALRFSF